MKKRILTYMKYIDDILSDSDQNYDYEKIIKEHLIQLEFFMHERLVHLLVTLTFALLAFGTFFSFVSKLFSIFIIAVICNFHIACAIYYALFFT